MPRQHEPPAQEPTPLTPIPSSPEAAAPSWGRRPVRALVAAGVVGAVLTAVPLVVMGRGGDSDQKVEAAPAGKAPAPPEEPGKAPAAGPPSPSPSPSASRSPSRSASPHAPVVDAKADPAPSAEETGGEETGGEEPKGPTAQQGTDKESDVIALQRRQIMRHLSSQGNALVQNVDTGKCADVPNFGKGTSGGPVNQYACRSDSSDNQLWDLQMASPDGGPGGAPLFAVKNRKDGLCMDLPGSGSVHAGARIVEYNCVTTGADNQLWWLDQRPAHGYLIRNRASDLCLAVTGGSSGGDDARLHVARCDTAESTGQGWMVTSVYP